MSRLIAAALALVASVAGPTPTAAHRAGPTSTTSTTTSTSTTSTTVAGFGPDAGGDGSVHDRIQGCESWGDPDAPPNYTAANKRSTASGAAQYLDSTWAGYGGYRRAMFAPPAVQEERFAADLAIGTRPWASSRGCWAR